MAKEKFLLVSLEEQESKAVAEVLGNATSKKIINYLSDKEDATETQIAKALGVPLSTVHYNLQKLKLAKLVEVEEFHYSKKGKEVDHYKLANKYVIITPKKVTGIKQKLKGILPVGLVIVGVGAIIQWATTLSTVVSAPLAAEFAEEAQSTAQVATAESARAASDAAIASAPQAITEAATQATTSYLGIYFIIGGLCALGLFTLYLLFNHWRKSR